MTGYEHLVWAPAVVTVAWQARKVAVRWLDNRDAQAARDAQRYEREQTLTATLGREVAALKEELGNLTVTVKQLKANAR